MAATDEGVWDQESRDALSRTLVKLGHPEEEMAALIPKAPVPKGPRYSIVSSVSFGSGFVDDEPEPEPQDDSDGKEVEIPSD